MSVPTLEKELGIEVYASSAPGVGGKIREFSEDFIVEEVLADGSKALISPDKALQLGGGGRYLICVLVKKDWDTFLAIREVAKRLGIHPKRVQIAGIKDAHAITAQHISISQIKPKQVSQVRIKGVTLQPIRFSANPVFSRLLLGNRFRIRIRAISHAHSVVEKRIEKARGELSSLGGFPNFFGHQRFGTIRPITHLVGRSITQGNWKKAALILLTQPSPHEHPESREARQQLQNTRDFRQALQYFPRQLRYERLMLTHLAKHSKDFVGAFRTLPLKLRRIFVQAYQSFLFNRFLSKRIKYGFPLNEAQAGDYVVKLDNNGLPTEESMRVTTNSIPSIEREFNENKMCVAIPLLGFKQNISEGVQGETEHGIVETEDVVQKDFYIAAMPEMSAPGRLRAILAPMINLSIELAARDSGISSKQEMQLNFTLHRGSYATVLLREFMKPLDLIKAGF